MTALLIPVILWATLVIGLCFVTGLCFIVYHLSKAGGEYHGGDMGRHLVLKKDGE